MASRCTAKAKTTGQRCTRPAIRGGNVCRYHGGNAPQVRAAAELRLLALVDPALAVLARLVRQRKNEVLAFKVAQDILDRNGVGVAEKRGTQAATVVETSGPTLVDASTLNYDAMSDEQLEHGRTFIDRLIAALEKPTERT